MRTRVKIPGIHREARYGSAHLCICNSSTGLGGKGDRNETTADSSCSLTSQSSQNNEFRFDKRSFESRIEKQLKKTCFSGL